MTDTSTGFLTVAVSTARGAIPLEGASVNIRGNDPDNSEILFSLITDRDGKTKKVALAAPPVASSTSPSIEEPFATYNIDVFKEGYTPLFFHGVPVFPSVHSIQPAVMIPSVGSSYENEKHSSQYPQSSFE